MRLFREIKPIRKAENQHTNNFHLNETLLELKNCSSPKDFLSSDNTKIIHGYD